MTYQKIMSSNRVQPQIFILIPCVSVSICMFLCRRHHGVSATVNVGETTLSIGLCLKQGPHLLYVSD